ncbi:MAG: prepilin-type N-terminal cleavage/methylation domain-containing protein [Myxococcaceae bacterium]|nr:prepilin-type N-terminal cleavage/methylation domain-containing protein [Myxococcaceae bacterium]MCA3016173.1 prepilin-type N-terminal cleavage/methylation domain-containing protein [Myxococcaceae bacterium]
MRRGFSLVELGIVIAVIAVLAAVVIFGRGFISSARITKAVDAANTARKAGSTFAGLNGGVVRAAGDQLQNLSQRGLIPTVPVGQAWTISGDPGTPDAIAVQEIHFQQLPRGTQASNAIRLQIRFPSQTMAQDYVLAVQNDNNFAVGTINGQQCQAAGIAGALPAVPASGVVQSCFFL